MRFTPNLTEVDAGALEVLPKGTYEISIESGKGFARKNRAGVDIFGVRYNCKVSEEGPEKGKTVLVNCYMHTDGAAMMSKRFVMAACGYNPAKAEEQKRFNHDYKDMTWDFDSDGPIGGSAWEEAVGARVIADMDIAMNKETNEPQQTYVWRPLNAAVATR